MMTTLAVETLDVDVEAPSPPSPPPSVHSGSFSTVSTYSIACASTQTDKSSFADATRLWSFKSVRLRIVLAVTMIVVAQGLMKTDMAVGMQCITYTHRPTVHLPIAENMAWENVTDVPFVDWSKHTQTQLFAAFYWGGLVSVLGCQYITSMFGPSRVLFLGTLLNAIGSIVTPFVIDIPGHGVWLVGIIRFIMGIGNGILLPCAAAIITVWFARTEKSTAVALYTCGNQISTIVCMYATAGLCKAEPHRQGWPIAFYAYGAFGFVASAIWMFVSCDNPSEHKGIADEELKFITAGRRCCSHSHLRTPWRKILSSLVVWACIMCTIAQSFVTISLTTYLPKYFDTVRSMELENMGLASAAPFIAQLVSKFILAQLADLCKRRTKWSTTNITKKLNTIGSVVSAISVILVGFMFDNSWAVVMLCVTMAALSGYVPGYYTALVSIAPRHSTAVNSLCRVFGQATSIAALYVTGLVTSQGYESEWQVVFIVYGGVIIVAMVIFQVCGSADEQEWA